MPKRWNQHFLLKKALTLKQMIAQIKKMSSCLKSKTEETTVEEWHENYADEAYPISLQCTFLL